MKVGLRLRLGLRGGTQKVKCAPCHPRHALVEPIHAANCRQNAFTIPAGRKCAPPNGRPWAACPIALAVAGLFLTFAPAGFAGVRRRRARPWRTRARRAFRAARRMD